MIKMFVAVGVCAIGSGLFGAQYRLKYQTTVDVIEDGAVVGKKTLKAGTVVEVAESIEAAKPAGKKSSGKLKPSDISPVMFQNTKPAGGAVLRAELSLGSFYFGPFSGKEEKYWSVCVDAKNDDWSYGKSFHGYVEKASPIGNRVAKFLGDGKDHKALVKLTMVKDADQNDIVLIHDFMEVTDKTAGE